MLCVNPPVAGLPLPNVPVNVSLYVPAFTPEVVWSVTVLVFGPVPVSDTGFGETVHVESAGAPLQASPTAPLKPLIGSKATVYVVILPGVIDCTGGRAKIAKSVVSCVKLAERLPMKLLSPE